MMEETKKKNYELNEAGWKLIMKDRCLKKTQQEKKPRRSPPS